MSGITIKIPNTSKAFTVAKTFTAKFNTPEAPAKYFFDGVFQDIVDVQDNTLYLLSSIEIGGDIPEAVYSESINVIPELTLSRKSQDIQLFRFAVPILGYSDGRDISAWYSCTNDNEDLEASISGVLNQTADTLGRTEIKLNITLNIYQIIDEVFIQDFLNKGMF